MAQTSEMADQRRRWDRCILCLSKTELTFEHVIPRALGGKLGFYFLCKRCNDEAGRILEAHVKEDPRIVLALGNLESRLPPKLFSRLSKNQSLLADSPNGKVLGRKKNGEFWIRPIRTEDSISLPNDLAEQRLLGIMEKRGATKQETDEALERHRTAPANRIVEIMPGLAIRKNTISNVRPALDGPWIGERLPLLIAYEFLAGLVRSEIYHEALNPVRQAILGRQTDEKPYQVEPVQGPEYAPFHCLAIEKNEPFVRVVIRLFEYVVFLVDFLCIRTRGKRLAYILDLNTSQHWLQPLDEQDSGESEEKPQHDN